MKLNEISVTIRLDNLYKNFLILVPYFIFPLVKIDFSLILPLLTLCLLSICCYLINDIVDAAQDSFLHHKKNKPLQRGIISKRDLYLPTSICLIFIVSLLFIQEFKVTLIIQSLIFLISSILYSLWGKKIILIDIFLLAINYSVRTFFATYPFAEIDLLLTFFLFYV